MMSKSIVTRVSLRTFGMLLCGLYMPVVFGGCVMSQSLVDGFDPSGITQVRHGNKRLNLVLGVGDVGGDFSKHWYAKGMLLVITEESRKAAHERIKNAFRYALLDYMSKTEAFDHVILTSDSVDPDLVLDCELLRLEAKKTIVSGGVPPFSSSVTLTTSPTVSGNLTLRSRSGREWRFSASETLPSRRFTQQGPGGVDAARKRGFQVGQQGEAYCSQAAEDFMGSVLGEIENLHDELALLETTKPTEYAEAAGKPKPLANQPRDDVWAVVVGISEYKYSGQNGLDDLSFAAGDAKAFASQLKQMGWSGDHIKLLQNESATFRDVQVSLDSWLTKADEDDMIVLFWSGHGFPDPEDPEKVYFACHDTDPNIPATGYRMDRIGDSLAERGARNVIVLADACHAGKLITRNDEKAIAVVPYVQHMKRKNLIPKGWVFMVGADTDRTAIEHSSWSNGAFTHCLLNALDGQADGYDSVGAKDGIVSLGEIRAYLMAEMPSETQRVLGTAKHPVVTTSTGDPDIWNLSLEP